jgi:hypothetical protein
MMLASARTHSLTRKEKPMKFVCFGYLDAEKWATLSSERQTALVDACFAYDESLKASDIWAGGEGLQGPPTARTLRLQSGKVSVTDGPFAETKELLGGLLIIEARDIDHAVEIMSIHPGVNMGPWEIRPTLDLTPIIRECQERRAKVTR